MDKVLSLQDLPGDLEELPTGSSVSWCCNSCLSITGCGGSEIEGWVIGY